MLLKYRIEVSFSFRRKAKLTLVIQYTSRISQMFQLPNTFISQDALTLVKVGQSDESDSFVEKLPVSQGRKVRIPKHLEDYVSY